MGKVIKFKHRGNFLKTLNFFKRVDDADYMGVLHKYGREGVQALRDATPKRTGETASSWSYKIEKQGRHKVTIYWTNSHRNKGVNIAMIIQYGHGTRQGAYVRGIDYINPAMRPVFDKLADEAWKEVTGSK